MRSSAAVHVKLTGTHRGELFLAAGRRNPTRGWTTRRAAVGDGSDELSLTADGHLARAPVLESTSDRPDGALSAVALVVTAPEREVSGRRIQVVPRPPCQAHGQLPLNPRRASTCTSRKRPKHCWQVAMIAPTEIGCEVKLESIRGGGRDESVWGVDGQPLQSVPHPVVGARLGEVVARHHISGALRGNHRVEGPGRGVHDPYVESLVKTMMPEPVRRARAISVSRLTRVDSSRRDVRTPGPSWTRTC